MIIPRLNCHDFWGQFIDTGGLVVKASTPAVLFWGKSPFCYVTKQKNY